MRTLITGGAGFIGSNLANRLIAQGDAVTIYDDLSRRGADKNIEWLRREHGDRWKLVHADVRDFNRIRAAVEGVEVVYHLASQVAVTTSVQDPRHDFEVNALGTLNVLEAARLSPDPPVVVYASTNKVYGDMKEIVIREGKTGPVFRDFPHGIAETQPLDFHSPYGCSKGAGDQYMRDYARIYNLRTVVLRQSCIYGPRQFGIEDQGWIAWFIIAALTGKPITIYGDGKQARDVLWIDDLIDVYQRVVERIDVASGGIYNVGGGPHNVLSVWTELGPLLEELMGKGMKVNFEQWRPGDQRLFVADIRKAGKALDWRPDVGKVEGVRRMFAWVKENKNLFAE